jgi:hypothetical protein
MSHFKYQLAAVYIQYAVCTQQSVSIYGIRSDLSIENINGSELVLEAAHYHTVLIAQSCNFKRVNVKKNNVLDLQSFALKYSPRMALRCRNM